jgi:hypothetical protein
MKMIAVWNIAPCSLFEVDPMVKPVRISEKSVYFSETTRRCILYGCYLRMEKMFTSFQTFVLVMLSLWVLSCELAGWSVTHEARVPVILRTLMIMISLVIINEDNKKRKCIAPNQNTLPFSCVLSAIEFTAPKREQMCLLGPLLSPLDMPVRSVAQSGLIFFINITAVPLYY